MLRAAREELLADFRPRMDSERGYRPGARAGLESGVRAAQGACILFWPLAANSLFRLNCHFLARPLLIFATKDILNCNT